MARRAGWFAIGASALALAGCGADSSGVEGPVTVYVSLPLTGPAGSDGGDAADGARLALEQADSRAGGLEVKASFLDDARGGIWDPAAVGANARRAAQDSSTAAYIGELDSEPTRASLPITNDAGIAQISPGASGIDLTAPAEGYPNSPEAYRPSGEVSFARVVPSDAVQVRALAEWARDLDLSPVAATAEPGPFGALMLREFTADLEELGVEVLGKGEEAAEIGADFAAGGADAGPGLLRSGDGVRTVSGVMVSQQLPLERFADDFERRFERPPGPYAAYGYESMALALQAIAEAEDDPEFRAGVRDAVLGAERSGSVLGSFSITDEGDTTLCRVQRYRGEGAQSLPEDATCP